MLISILESTPTVTGPPLPTPQSDPQPAAAGGKKGKGKKKDRAGDKPQEEVKPPPAVKGE